MIRIIPLLLLFITGYLSAQSDEERLVKNTIETFFDGFHKGDTTVMRSVMHDRLVMQTAYKNKEGNDVLTDRQDALKLVEAIANRASDQKWDERLLDFSILIDGNMALAWTPYEFWLNDEFLHCGVNSFQLFKNSGQWKIIYLIDTRRRSDCRKTD
ncbi:MAG: nuclear transport factor 2 family protein [Bacteroidia bacterium]|nr:nuclear transport factor 2 family protein [Bacteroidia bacterium]NNK73127.1 nuclear transport factor 2 family protein [Flavobacteriaceae bacterium]